MITGPQSGPRWQPDRHVYADRRPGLDRLALADEYAEPAFVVPKQP